ncbi:diguanylate cyclase [Massilia phosphatilytica]
MAAEVARAARERTPLSLVMMDVDFFKRYNDAYGHAAGDDCLRMVAGVLAATVNRPADLAARFGGEEFAVLLPNTPPDGARGIAEAICRGVRAAGMAHRASDLGFVTISAGVATMMPAPGDDARALVEAADAALYGAKASGRNRVGMR